MASLIWNIINVLGLLAGGLYGSVLSWQGIAEKNWPMAQTGIMLAFFTTWMVFKIVDYSNADAKAKKG